MKIPYVVSLLVVLALVVVVLMTVAVTDKSLSIDREKSFQIGVYPATGIVSVYAALPCTEEARKEEYTVCIGRNENKQATFEKLKRIIERR